MKKPKNHNINNTKCFHRIYGFWWPCTCPNDYASQSISEEDKTAMTESWKLPPVAEEKHKIDCSWLCKVQGVEACMHLNHSECDCTPTAPVEEKHEVDYCPTGKCPWPDKCNCTTPQTDHIGKANETNFTTTVSQVLEIIAKLKANPTYHEPQPDK